MSRFQPIHIDTKNAAFARMKKAGFDFEIDPSLSPIAGFMTCVCGRKEYFSFSPNDAINNKIDVAGIAEIIGSASAKHLKEDGYTSDQIRLIRKAFV